MENPCSGMTPERMIALLAEGVERGDIVAYFDDDGDACFVHSTHASGYHRDHAIPASALWREAQECAASLWN